MIYWAWPPDGAGHAVRAASVCRHFSSDYVVVRGTDDPKINRALDEFNIPYVVIPSLTQAIAWVKKRKHEFLVLDGNGRAGLDDIADVWIWRLGRPERLSRPVPTLRIEGAGGIWPLLMLEDDEILSRYDAREALGLPQDKHLTIGVGSTCRPGVVEAGKYDYWLNEWPALRYLRAADKVVGCPGANLFGEVSYLGLDVEWLKCPGASDQPIRMQVAKGWIPISGASKTLANTIEQLAGVKL